MNQSHSTNRELSKQISTEYNKTEVGIIPKDWKVVEIGSIGEVKMCRRIFNHETKPVGPIPFFKIGTFGKEPDAFISKELYSSYRQRFSFPKPGDILISAAGTIGRTLIYDGEPAYFQDSNIVWIDNNESLISNVLLSHVFKIVKYDTEGGTIQRLYNGILKATKFALPPTRAEQQSIATALSDADAHIESLEKLIAKKRAIKKGVMQELLTGKRRLPGFSGEWEVKGLGALLRFQVGFPFSSNFFNKTGEGIRLVKNRDLKSDDQVFYYNGKFDDSFVVRNGDVLIGMDGDFLPCRWEKGHALLNQRVGRIVPSAGLNIAYAFYALIEPLKEIENITSSTTVKHLSHDDVEGIELPLPNHLEQTAIAQVLIDIDTDITAHEAKLSKARLIKQGMMQELFTGRIRLV